MHGNYLTTRERHGLPAGLEGQTHTDTVQTHMEMVQVVGTHGSTLRFAPHCAQEGVFGMVSKPVAVSTS
jgi:hypothetical protein